MFIFIMDRFIYSGLASLGVFIGGFGISGVLSAERNKCIRSAVPYTVSGYMEDAKEYYESNKTLFNDQTRERIDSLEKLRDGFLVSTIVASSGGFIVTAFARRKARKIQRNYDCEPITVYVDCDN